MPNIVSSTFKLNSIVSNRNYFPKNDLNILLNYFNELDSNNRGIINRKAAQIFFRSI
jgi:hypothetical protein